MAEGCAGNCAKIILIIFNILLLLSGVALIAVGAWILADDSFTEVVGLTISNGAKLFRASAIVLIAMGTFVLIVSLLGFIGAILENRVLLAVYLSLQILIFCGEIAGGVIAIVFKDKILEELQVNLKKSIVELSYYANDNKTCLPDSTGFLWDLVQVKFNCCGVNDWAATGYEQLPKTQLSTTCPGFNLPVKERITLPFTCCLSSTEETYQKDQSYSDFYSKFNCTMEENIKTTGCMESIQDWIEYYSPILIGIGIGIAMLQLFGILFTVCLCRNVDSDKI